MAPRIHAALFALCALGLAACSTTETTPPPPVVSSTEELSPGKTLRENVVSVSAVVEAIDHATRRVTLRGPEGELTTFRVDESARNLGQVKQGDLVEATYYQSVAVHLKKPGEATPGVSAAQAAGRAEPGEMPGAAGVRSVTLVATVRALDREQGTATLEAADGSTQTVAVRNPQHFDVARVGDLVEITFTEAVAISVEKPAGD